MIIKKKKRERGSYVPFIISKVSFSQSLLFIQRGREEKRRYISKRKCDTSISNVQLHSFKKEVAKSLSPPQYSHWIIGDSLMTKIIIYKLCICLRQKLGHLVPPTIPLGQFILQSLNSVQELSMLLLRGHPAQGLIQPVETLTRFCANRAVTPATSSRITVGISMIICFSSLRTESKSPLMMIERNASQATEQS